MRDGLSLLKRNSLIMGRRFEEDEDEVAISFEEFNNLKRVIKSLSGSVSASRRLICSSDKSNVFNVYDEEQRSY